MTDPYEGYTLDELDPPPLSICGCECNCHRQETEPDWPGPCAACCEPGDDCECGRALAHLSG